MSVTCNIIALWLAFAVGMIYASRWRDRNFQIFIGAILALAALGFVLLSAHSRF